MHVPLAPPDQPSVAPLQALQSPVQAELQQTPSTQLPEVHIWHGAVLQSASRSHVVPLDLRATQPPSALQ